MTALFSLATIIVTLLLRTTVCLGQDFNALAREIRANKADHPKRPPPIPLCPKSQCQLLKPVVPIICPPPDKEEGCKSCPPKPPDCSKCHTPVTCPPKVCYPQRPPKCPMPPKCKFDCNKKCPKPNCPPKPSNGYGLSKQCPVKDCPLDKKKCPGCKPPPVCYPTPPKPPKCPPIKPPPCQPVVCPPIKKCPKFKIKVGVKGKVGLKLVNHGG